MVKHSAVWSINLRVPADVSVIQEQNTSTGHGGWRGSLQMTNLEEQPHGWREWDTLITGQSKNLVVVHDGVQ